MTHSVCQIEVAHMVSHSHYHQHQWWLDFLQFCFHPLERRFVCGDLKPSGHLERPPWYITVRGSGWLGGTGVGLVKAGVWSVGDRSVQTDPACDVETPLPVNPFAQHLHLDNVFFRALTSSDVTFLIFMIYSHAFLSLRSYLSHCFIKFDTTLSLTTWEVRLSPFSACTAGAPRTENVTREVLRQNTYIYN